ncbi:bromodomain-containing protein, putative [Eimeria mitis]|uniref:Bromodomain-containing protein, putative n=1 Tax=Eimeria mitis TaxID=44415 RepID=U6KKD0_9EIME|nr:bromodomain-containing protein, putative [Eimeria mitis]CDJ35893.1 bromodomain-containing protein, putative [Eimeria mitis]
MPVSGGPFSMGPVSPNVGTSGGSDPQRGAVPGGGGGPLARHVKRKLAGLLDGWRRVKSFRLFLEPVDTEQMECPTYYDVIKHPMDLRTMEAKLERDEYRSEEAFVADLLLIFRNCRTFNDEATPAGQFVLRLCAEAEARSLEDLKKACKDSKLWTALEQQFSHGKQKAGARQKSGGASKRAVSGVPSAPESAAPAAAAAPPAATGVAASATGRPGAADHHPPPLSYDGVGRDTMGASPGAPCMNGLPYSGSPAAGEDAAPGAGTDEAAVSEKLEGGPAASDKVSETTQQQTSISGLPDVVSPPRNPLTPAATGSHRGPLQANWQVEGGPAMAQGMLDMENCLTGKSWYIYCRDNILRPLKGDRYAYLFLTPVLDSPELPDAVKTSYKSVIARPMDYGTIWTKLTARDYQHPLEFFEDMFLVYSNCMAFNPPNDQQCGWLHRVAERSRDKFVERWRRWVVRIWRAFAQHNAAAAAAPSPALQHAEAAKAAAAVESEPAIAAGLAAARAELLDRRQSHSAMPFPLPQQQLQQQAEHSPAPLQHPQLQHPPVQHHRGRDEPQDTVPMTASAAAAAKDPKYRALVVDLLGEDALEDASNSSLDRGATTQETLQQQLQQLQQQQQLLQHEHLQLQQQQLEMQEKEQELARASAAGEGPIHSENIAGMGSLGSSDVQQQEQQQQQQLPVSDPAGEHSAAVASPGAPAASSSGSDAPFELQGDAGAAEAGDGAVAAAEGKKHKGKKQKHHKHMHRSQQQLVQQDVHNVQLAQEASSAFQQPGVLQTIHQADSAAAQGYNAAAGTDEAAPTPAATGAAPFTAAPAGTPRVDSPSIPPGPAELSSALTDAFPATVSTQHDAAAAAAAGAAAATPPGNAAASSILPVPSLGDSPRLCDIIEAPPVEILKAMGVKDMSALPAAAAPAAAAAPVSTSPAAVPLAAADATLTGLPPAADTTAAVSTTWLAGGTPSQLSVAPGAAAVAAAPTAAAAGVRVAAGVEPPLLLQPVDGVISAIQMQRSAGLHDLQQQQQQLLLQQQATREDLLPPKLRIVLESARRKGPPPRLLLLPWRGRGTGPIPEGYAVSAPGPVAAAEATAVGAAAVSPITGQLCIAC